MTTKQAITFWSEYIKLVDIMDGIISEHGELSLRYWKKGVETEMEDITFMVLTTDDVVRHKDRITANFKLLMDGLNGWASEGRSVSRYGSLSNINISLFE